MKKIHIILISILCGLSSCTSVLDKEPLDIISDDVLWNDPVLIDNYLLQCYAEMCFFNEMPYGATQDWFNCMYATGFADESTSAWTQTPKTHWLNISGGDWDWWGYPTVRKLNVFIEKMETAPGRRSRPDGPHGRGPLPPGIRLFQHGQALRRRASDPESAATFRFARRALPETRDRGGRLPVHSRRDERHHRQPAAPRRIRSGRSGTTDTLCRRRIEKPSRDVRG